MQTPHEILQEYIGTLVRSSDINSLIIKGVNGIGKSYTIVQTLNALGLVRNKHYIVLTGHITPLQLYHIIGNTASLEKPRLIVFDDVDAIVQNKTAIALLKSALWDIEGKRLVSYHSSSAKLEGPMTVEFKGKIIVVLNNLKQENAFGKPLLDRGIMYDMTMQTEEVISYVEKILPDLNTKLKLSERQKVWDEIKRFADNPAFSIRSLLRAMEFRRIHPTGWLPLYIHSLRLTHEQKILYTVREEYAIGKEAMQEWCKRTGKSRAEFYRTQRELTYKT